MNISNATSMLVLRTKDTAIILQMAITATAQELHIQRKVVGPMAMGTYMEMATTLIISMVRHINKLIVLVGQALLQKWLI